MADRYAQRKEYDSRTWFENVSQGLCVALGLIVIIMAPILLFSGLSPGLVNNPVLTASMDL